MRDLWLNDLEKDHDKAVGGNMSVICLLQVTVAGINLSDVKQKQRRIEPRTLTCKGIYEQRRKKFAFPEFFSEPSYFEFKQVSAFIDKGSVSG
jgi:hypothetical protein